MFPVSRVLVALIPIAVKIGKAMRKDSPGGKRILPEELLAILLGEADDLIDQLNQ